MKDPLAHHIKELQVKRDRLRAELDELEADLAALYRVVERRLIPAPLDEAAPPANGPVSLIDAIRRVIAGFDGRWTSRDVVESLEAQHPGLVESVDQSSIPGALNRLAKRGEIEVAEPGRGRRRTVYKPPHPPLNLESASSATESQDHAEKERSSVE